MKGIAPSFEVNGIPPDLAGKRCEAFLCEQFMVGGELVDSAKTTYIKAAGVWHCLNFGDGSVFWRTQIHDPHPWDLPAEGWEYPHKDIGQCASVIGESFSFYAISPTATGSKVEFWFSNNRCVVLENQGKVTSCVFS